MANMFFSEGKWQVRTPFHPWNRGFFYGESIFTSLKTFQGFYPFWPDHLKRLRQSWQFLFPYTSDGEWRHFLASLRDALEQLRHLAFPEHYLRIMMWAPWIGGRSQEQTANWEFGPYQVAEQIEFALLVKGEARKQERQGGNQDQEKNKGITLAVSSFKREDFLQAPSFLKIPQYALSFKELRGLLSFQVHDFVSLNLKGKVTEASTSNIFMIKDEVVYTPGLSVGILDGIIRKNLINCLRKYKFKMMVKNFDLSMLTEADEIFLTNAVKGIMPVTEFIPASPFLKSNFNEKRLPKRSVLTTKIKALFDDYKAGFLYEPSTYEYYE